MSEFMIGLEKTKAKQGEVSQSARALLLDDVHRLHDYCMMRHGLDNAERRRGIVRYVCIMIHLYSWLECC